jgi:hypothetical protein
VIVAFHFAVANGDGARRGFKHESLKAIFVETAVVDQQVFGDVIVAKRVSSVL